MKRINLEGFEKLEAFANGLLFLIKRFQELSDEYKERSGGYLTILCAQTGQVLHVIKIGVIPENKAKRYLNFSMEKAFRLFQSADDILTSFETRNPEKHKYGGAIRTTDYILSFSGLTEEGDSAVLLRLAYSFDMMPIDDNKAIQAIIGNIAHAIYPHL